MTFKVLAIIPARAGSKGLPGKNIKELCGLPLIGYSIKAALESKHVSKVIVSTDCEEIYKLSISLGADKSFLRPKELAQDDSLAIDCYKYTIERLENEVGDLISSFIVLQPTSPLRTAKNIDDAIDLFLEKNADSVISVCGDPHPLNWSKKISIDGRLSDIFTSNNILNRQEYEETFTPNGAVYVFKTSLIRSGLYINDNTYGYIMPRKCSIDIDTIDDFEYAEFLIGRQKCSQ